MEDEQPFDGDSHLLPREDVGKLWARFRGGEHVPCPRCTGGAFALSVDGVAKAYRLVCVACGTSTPWFASNSGQIIIRAPSQTISPEAGHD